MREGDPRRGGQETKAQRKSERGGKGGPRGSEEGVIGGGRAKDGRRQEEGGRAQNKAKSDLERGREACAQQAQIQTDN